MTSPNFGLTCTSCSQTIAEGEKSERYTVRDFLDGQHIVQVRHVECPTIVEEYRQYQRRLVDAQTRGPSFASLLPMRYPKVSS